MTAAKSASPRLMEDGSESFPYLWRHFLRHVPLRAWLMRADPYATASVSPAQAARGIAFCCNFTVPNQWADMSPSFALGEMFIPHHPYKHFMCGTVVAATAFHKHLVCALGPLASRHPECLPSYQTCVRRMVIDIGSTGVINCLEFSWMQDGTLIVMTKILVPPEHPNLPFQTAGLSGAFALFRNVSPAGLLPSVPESIVSFLEVPTCPLCLQTGALGCYCSHDLRAEYATGVERSSAVWPPRLRLDAKGSSDECYQNIRIRLDMIRQISHVKITAHMVTPRQVKTIDGASVNTYKLGPSRFVIKAVVYKPSNSFQSDTLRQVADKLRLLCSASLSVANEAYNTPQQTHTIAETDIHAEEDHFDLFNKCLKNKHPSKRRRVTTPVSSTSAQLFDVQWFPVRSAASSHVSIANSSYEDAITEASAEDDHIVAPSSKKHCDSHASRSASISGQNLTDNIKESMPTSQRQKVPKRHMCPKCNKTFSQQGSLNRHLKNIHEESKIPCQYCHMSFGQMYDLQVCCMLFLIFFIKVITM